MKNKIRGLFLSAWQLLTEVPGWPDAPVWMRLKRGVPVVLPILGVTAVLGWHLFWYAPRVRAEEAALQPLAALEDEISNLQIQCSEQQATELGERAEVASRLLLEGPQELPATLRALKKEAADRGWDAALVAGDLEAEKPVEGALVRWLPVRGKLTPPVGPERFSTLLSLLERFSTFGKRIDLMRVAVRADENRWQAVEVNLRLVCPVPNEKTP